MVAYATLTESKNRDSQNLLENKLH